MTTAPTVEGVLCGSSPLDGLHALLGALWEEADRQERPVPADHRLAFSTALAEVAANALEHAGAASLLVVVSARPDSLTGWLQYTGEPFEGAGTSPDDELPESGRGLGLVEMLVDEVAYERDGPLNRWLVTRHL